MYHNVIRFVWGQGIFISFALFIAWTLSGICRYLEYRQVLQRKRQGADKDNKDAGAPTPKRPRTRSATSASPLPAISVVMPVKGLRPYAEQYWESQVTCPYGGEAEFIFVVDEKEDEAYPALLALKQRLESSGAAAGPITVHVAGPSSTCSQKILNQVAGFRAASPRSKYVVFLDNDILLHRGTFETLVAPLEEDASVFMSTGYPFDVPMERAGLLSYSVLSYHLPLMVPFSLLDEGPFVWGGCMVFRAEELRSDRVGLIKGWLDGGYSDDLLVTSKCGEMKLRIKSPKSAIFAQLVGRYSFQAFANYLYRQLYVLDTYSTPLGRRLNLVLALVHGYLSSAYVIAYFTAIAVCVAGAVCALRALLAPGSPYQEAFMTLVNGGEGADQLEMATRLAGALWGEARLCMPQLGLASLMWASTFLVSAGQRVLTWGAVRLLNELAEGKGLTREGGEKGGVSLGMFDFYRLWLGFIFMNTVLPPLVLAVFSGWDVVDWAGIKYRKRGGKVTRL